MTRDFCSAAECEALFTRGGQEQMYDPDGPMRSLLTAPSRSSYLETICDLFLKGAQPTSEPGSGSDCKAMMSKAAVQVAVTGRDKFIKDCRLDLRTCVSEDAGLVVIGARLTPTEADDEQAEPEDKFGHSKTNSSVSVNRDASSGEGVAVFESAFDRRALRVRGSDDSLFSNGSEDSPEEGVAVFESAFDRRLLLVRGSDDSLLSSVTGDTSILSSDSSMDGTDDPPFEFGDNEVTRL